MIRYINSFIKPFFDQMVDDIAHSGTVHYQYLAPATIDEIRARGYKVTTWDIHTLISPRG